MSVQFFATTFPHPVLSYGTDQNPLSNFRSRCSRSHSTNKQTSNHDHDHNTNTVANLVLCCWPSREEESSVVLNSTLTLHLNPPPTSHPHHPSSPLHSTSIPHLSVAHTTVCPECPFYPSCSSDHTSETNSHPPSLPSHPSPPAPFPHTNTAHTSPQTAGRVQTAQPQASTCETISMGVFVHASLDRSPRQTCAAP